MKKENLDREALLLLKALVETQNLVRAAQSLDMPAATASRTLARLRDLFGDTLFTRCAGGLTPTARVLELAAKAQAVLSDMEKLLEPAVFDPASLKRSFRIACVDHGGCFGRPPRHRRRGGRRAWNLRLWNLPITGLPTFKTESLILRFPRWMRSPRTA